jgi:hypothetical protein
MRAIAPAAAGVFSGAGRLQPNFSQGRSALSGFTRLPTQGRRCGRIVAAAVHSIRLARSRLRAHGRAINTAFDRNRDYSTISGYGPIEED